jgi:hypothetical protein
MVLKRAFKFGLVASCVSGIWGQSVGSAVQHLTVAIHDCNASGLSGTGFIVADHKSSTSPRVRTLYIVTAAHVVGEKRDNIRVRLFNNGKWGLRSRAETGALSCSVKAYKISGNPNEEHPSRNEDFALLGCEVPSTFKGSFEFSDLSSPKELRPHAPLMMSITAPPIPTAECQPPPEDPTLFPFYFSFKGVEPAQTAGDKWKYKPGIVNQTITFFNPLVNDVEGASGGPLLTERSEIAGMVYEARGQNHSEVRAFTWDTIKGWLGSEGFDEKSVSLRSENPSGAELRRLNIEVSAETEALYVSGFGWLPTTPELRVSTSIPRAAPIRLAFDFATSQGTIDGETVKLTLPSVTGELHLGSILDRTRHIPALAGVYLGAGITFANLQRSIGASQVNIQSLGGVFDAGWRYRFPGRNWGLHASYREGVLYENQPGSNQQVYPRFRASTLGMFLVFK